LQGVLAEFLSRGHFAAYVRAARTHYEASRDALLQAIDRHWSPAVTAGPSDTGLHLVTHFPDTRDDRALARTARLRGLGVSALTAHYHGPTARSGLLLSFGAATASDIEADVASLAPELRD
jgi:GntR family transcriptional regulator / MocR family aminotransferase